MKKTLLTVTVLGSVLVSTQAFAGASANIGATTNYLWRGMSQSDGHPAIQGGLDYSAANGLYVGTWASSEKFIPGASSPTQDGLKHRGTELDLYGGYKKELKNGLSYDVGAVKYNYPNKNSTEFSEFYIKPSYKGVGAEVDYTFQTNDTTTNKKGDVYYGLGYTHSLKDDWSYGAKVGRYNYKDSASRYNNAQLSLTKTIKKAGDFTLAVDKATGALPASLNNGKKDARVSLTWKKSFDF